MKKTVLSLFASAILANTLLAQVGIIDPNFNLGSGFGPDEWTGKCESIIQQPDGKLIVGGSFKTFNAESAFYIARLNLDGSRDVSFSSPFEDNWGYKVNAIAVQNDGKIIIGGEFNQINGVSRNRIARLNSNGTLDESFNPAAGFNSEVKAVTIQPDGKILVGGIFTVYDFVWGAAQIPVNRIARLNADGTLDSSFNLGTGFGGGDGVCWQPSVNKIIVQPDGKTLAAGCFGNYNGATSLLVARINSDGTFDDTFNANELFALSISGFYGAVYTMKLLPDGKIVIGGNYHNTNSLGKGVNRLNADGSMDNTFNISHATDLRNFAMDVQSDGKVLAANVNFGPANEAYVVERYLADGSLDESFPKKFLNRDVTDLIIQNDGNITFVGHFNYNPTGIMRLIGDTPQSVNTFEPKAAPLNIYPNPANDFLTITNLEKGSLLSIADISGKVVYHELVQLENTTINTTEFANGVYFIQHVLQGKINTGKMVISK